MQRDAIAKTGPPDTWRRSSYSGTNGECVEATASALTVIVRDSKNPEGARLVIGHAAWRVFATGLKARGRTEG